METIVIDSNGIVDQKEAKEYIKKYKRLKAVALKQLKINSCVKLLVLISKWKSKNKIRSKKWEKMVRAGKVVEELKFYMKSESYKRKVGIK